MAAVFTPRFVDLVRTFTASQGTGPLVPGAAVQGFSTFADTMSAGDQFYYCVQGIDRPTEREVGRGTLQANGTIARQPVSGGLVPFSSGTKTINLVAAAEWFTQQHSTSGGGHSGTATVADRAALAAIAAASAGDVRLLLEAGREGLFVFDDEDLTAMVLADGRQGMCVAPASAPSGSAGAWVRKSDGPINIRWFGAMADFVTDDLPAFIACREFILAQGRGGQAGNQVMSVPAGRYYLADRFDTKGLRIVGEHSAQPSGASTLLRFGKNKSGIRLTAGANDSASTLENVQLWGGGITVDSKGTVTSYAVADSNVGNGVEVACNWGTCVNVASYFFGGAGFSVNSNAPASLSNCFYLERCQSQYNRGDGYVFNGADANAGTTINCSAISCGGAGFREYSFLGNTHIQAHVRDCGIVDPSGGNGPVGTCKYGTSPAGHYYVVAGREAKASAEVPGSVSDGSEAWRPFGGHANCRSWASGQNWVCGAPYVTNPANSNGRNVLLGCYAEGAQAPIQAFAPTMIVGGMLDEVSVDQGSTAVWQRGSSDGTLTVPGLTSWRPGTPANVGGVDPIPVRAANRAWSISQPGERQGSLHLCHAGNNGEGAAITFGYAGSGGTSAGAGLYVLSDASSYGSRMLLATTDSFAAGAKTFLLADENGNVDFLRGSVKAHSPVTTQAAVNYTATLSDRDSYIRFTSGSAVTFTIPPSASVNLPVGTEITFEQGGGGAITPSPGAGVVINRRGNVSATAGQYAVATLKKVGADSWTLTGDLA